MFVHHCGPNARATPPEWAGKPVHCALGLQVSVLFIFITLVPAPTTSLWKIDSVTLTTLNTAGDGNTNPPLCLKAVNLACRGATDSCEA